MKPDETQWRTREIAVQPELRKMHGMHTNASNFSGMNAMSMRVRVAQGVLVALLVAANTAHADDAPATTVERPLDLSLPRDALVKPAAPKAPGDGRKGGKPYGSGFEARRFDTGRDNAASAAGQASGASTGASASGWRGATAGPGAGAGSGGNRSGAGRHGRR